MEQFDDERTFGHLSKIDLFHMDNLEKDVYLHFDNDVENVQTLIVRLKDEQFSEEVKVKNSI
jgi:hypothetical protein